MRPRMGVTAPTGRMSRLSTPPGGRTNRSRRSVTARPGIPTRPIQALGDLARPRRARVDRGADRDADAARHAAVPTGARPRHSAEPQPGRRHQHDHGSVFADARRLHAAARAGQRSGISGKQSGRPAGAAIGHLPAGHRDGDDCGHRLEPHSRQSRHPHPRQGGRYRRARRPHHLHLADERRAGHDRDDDEPGHVRDVLIAGRGRVLEGQARGLERRCPVAADRASPRARSRAHQRHAEARRAAAGQQQLRGSLPPELPRLLLREGAEHDGARVCVEALSACSPDWRRSRKSGNGRATDCGCPGFSLRFNPGYACWPEAAIPPRSRAAPRLRRLRVRPLLQGLGDAIGEGLDRADIGLRRLVGFGAVLFPIAQGRERDAVTLAELFLGETQPRPHELHARKWFHPRKLGVGQRLRIGIGQRRRVNLRVGHGVGARPVEIVRTDPCGFLHDSAFVPLVPPASPRSGAAVAGSYM